MPYFILLYGSWLRYANQLEMLKLVERKKGKERLGKLC